MCWPARKCVTNCAINVVCFVFGLSAGFAFLKILILLVMRQRMEFMRLASTLIVTISLPIRGPVVLPSRRHPAADRVQRMDAIG